MEPIQVPKIGTCILKCFCGSRISIINKILFFKNVNESLLFCIWSRYGTLQGHFGIGMKAVITQTSTHDKLTCIFLSQDQFANDANYELVCVPPAPDEKQIMM